MPWLNCAKSITNNSIILTKTAADNTLENSQKEAIAKVIGFGYYGKMMAMEIETRANSDAKSCKKAYYKKCAGIMLTYGAAAAVGVASGAGVGASVVAGVAATVAINDAKTELSNCLNSIQ